MTHSRILVAAALAAAAAAQTASCTVGLALNAAQDPAAQGARYEIALNAAGTAPDWVQLIPRGPLVAGRDGRSFWVESPEAVIAATQSWLPLVLDFEHASEMPGTDPKPAAGWIEELDVRDGSIWGRVNWTERAMNMVAAREYRFISPAFSHLKNERADIVRLSSAALVHNPNLNLTALNRAGDPSLELPMLKDILAALGLADTATATDAVVAINALKAEKTVALNAAEHPPLEKFIPKAQHDAVQTALNSANAELQAIKAEQTKARVEALIADAVEAGKIAPAAKPHFEAMALNSFDATKAAIDAMPALLKAGQQPEVKTDPAAATGALTPDEVAMCARMNLTHEAYLATKKLDAAA